MTIVQNRSGMHDKLTQVRTAYRLLHAYHRRLFNLLVLTRDAVAARFGELPAAWWGPGQFDRPPKEQADPTEKWVFDFIPLQRAYFSWASARRPLPGSFHFAIWHDGDDGLDWDPSA